MPPLAAGANRRRWDSHNSSKSASPPDFPSSLGLHLANIPYRDPLTTAKMVTTLDVLSRGRAILGAGTGWMTEEFDALNVPYAERGARTEEYLAIMKVLWTEKTPSYDGRFYRFGEVKFEPKPVQQPHPPIWIGGHTDVAIRRALRLR